MFNCTRRPSKKSKEKLEFSIQFHATQVHTAWDKLAVSLVSLDSGRITGKTRKASVRNGQCYWPDAVLETAKLLFDMKTHLYDEKLYKFVVSKGFSRSCVLGEVIINITEYVSAVTPTSLTLPLRFCYAGTLLHVKIQCLTPKCSNKPFYWLKNMGHVSDADLEPSACGTPSPAHNIYRSLSVGSHSPVAASAMGEGSRIVTPSPTANSEKKSGMISISYVSMSSPAPSQVLDKTKTSASIDEWKSVAEKLSADLVAQKQELANVKMDADIDKASYMADREALQTELEQLRSLNADLRKKSECKDHIDIINELKEELGLKRAANSSLNIQNQKLRKSNMELLLVVRDLESSLEEHTRNTERLLKCKVYNNPCADADPTLEGEERFSEYSYAAETTDKNIDKILDLNRNSDRLMDEDAPRIKTFMSAVSEDLNNMRVVLDELDRQTQAGDCYTSAKEQLLIDLKALVEGCEGLIADLQKQSISGSADDAANTEEVLDNIVHQEVVHDDPEELKDLRFKIADLTTEKEEVESMLKKYMEQEESRKMKVDQLEAQLLEFAHDLEYMQDSNKQLETMLGVTKTEKQQLEQIVKNIQVESGMADRISQRIAELEEQLQRMELEREDYLLERCVAENLARDLCREVRSMISDSQNGSEGREGFIYHMKELRRSFSLLEKKKESDICIQRDEPEDVVPFRDNAECVDPDVAVVLQEELDKKSLKLKDLEFMVGELTAHKEKLERALKTYESQEEIREIRMDQLEAQLLEFAKELDHMQESNEQLESVLDGTKAEKQLLERALKDFNEECRKGSQGSEALSERMMELEGRLKRMDEEREVYVLEKSVAENLARDLCEQLQAIVHDDEELVLEENECQQHDFISYVKKLRTSFTSLAKNARKSADNLRELQLTCDSLEDRLTKEHDKTMAAIAFLDEQFGQLSKDSDQKLGKFNQEVEVLLAKFEQEHEERRSQGFLRLALEENVCEIAYLRDEIRRLKDQNAVMTRENEGFKSEVQNLEAESVQWQSTLAELQEQFKQVEHLKDANSNTPLVTSEKVLNTLVSEEESLEKVLIKLQDQHFLQTAEWQQMLMEMQEKIMQLETSTGKEEREILSKINAFETDLEGTMKILVCMRTDNSALGTEIDRLHLDNARLREENVATDRLIVGLKDELEQCKTLIIRLTDDLSNSEAILRSERDQREEATNKCMRLTGEIKELNQKLLECSNFDKKFVALQETIEDKTRALDHNWNSAQRDLHMKESLISEKLVSLEEAYRQTRISFDAVVFELGQCKDVNFELEKALQNLKSQLDAKKELEENVMHLKEENKARLSELNEKKQLEIHNLQIIISRMEADAARKAQEREDRRAEVATQTDIGHESEGSATSSNEGDGRYGRRKWKPQHDDQELCLLELRAKITSLESELTSKALQLSSSVDKSREREATLCEKIVHLEVAKRLLEEELSNRRDESGLLAQVEECKLAQGNLEGTINRLQAQLQAEKVLLAEKVSEYACLKKEHEELKLANADCKEKHAELVKMVSSKEAEVSLKALELESLKLELQEKETFLWKRIEYLELANEQLADQQVDSGLGQLKKELTRLQNHNSELARREHELTSKLNAYELLQLELQRLQEENEQLEQKFLKLKDASLWGDTLERLVYLETELAEALETNNMYKLQLQNAFAKDVPGADARGNEIEGILSNLLNFRKQTLYLETELKDMQERYLTMSMRYAEIQSEKEELLMTVKALRSAR